MPAKAGGHYHADHAARYASLAYNDSLFMSKGRFLIGFALAVIFLYLFLRNIDLHELVEYGRRGSLGWLSLALTINLFNYYLRSFRWRYFFMPIKKTRMRNLFVATVIGFSASTIFPARIGELVRPYLLGAKENIGKSAALATIIVERVFDSLAVVSLLVFYLLVLVRPEQLSPQARSSLELLKRAGVLVFAATLAIAIFLYYLKTNPAGIRKIVKKIERFLPAKAAHSLDDILDSFIEGLAILHDPKILFTISFWSIVLWVAISFGFWCVIRAYLPVFAFRNTFLIMILLAIGVAIPTPGGVGSYDFMCKFALVQFFGVAGALAGAIALISHFLAFVPVTILGVAFFSHEGLNAAKLKKIAEAEKEA
jgi:glycosyltransferase 2 family protein